MKSWKTTVGGILYAIGTAIASDATLSHYSQLVQSVGVLLIGAAARDNNVTSSDLKLTDKKPTP